MSKVDLSKMLSLDWGAGFRQRSSQVTRSEPGPKISPPPQVAVTKKKVITETQKKYSKVKKKLDLAIAKFKTLDKQNTVFFTLNIPPNKVFTHNKRTMRWDHFNTEDKYNIIRSWFQSKRRHLKLYIITSEFGSTTNKFHFHGVYRRDNTFDLSKSIKFKFSNRYKNDKIIPNKHLFETSIVSTDIGFDKHINYITKDISFMMSDKIHYFKLGDWSFKCTLNLPPLIKNI